MKIVIIGAGNIATHYAIALHALGHEISQIYSRTSANAKVLADAVSAKVLEQIDQLDNTADLYIIAVSDNNIADIALKLDTSLKGIVVHTSGATPLAALNNFNQFGVIYPPQSLNKNINADLSQIPFAIEGNNEITQNILLHTFQEISKKTFLCSTQQRLALHVASVFANNFSTILFDISKTILEKENLDFELIKPIILETALKVQNHDPHAVQTGPALRNDHKTINTHLQFLSYSNDLSEIYQLLTDFIVKSRYK